MLFKREVSGQRLFWLWLLLLCLRGPVMGAAPGAGPPPAASFDDLLRRLKTAPADTNKLPLYLQLYEEVPPGFNLEPVLEEGHQLALRLKQRTKALALRGKLVLWALDRQDFVAATRYAQALLREARQAPVQYLYTTQAANGLGNVAGAEKRFADARKWFRVAGQEIAKAPPSARRLQLMAVSVSNLTQAYVYEIDGMRGAPPDSLLRGARSSLRQQEQTAKQFLAAGNERQYQGFMGNAWDSYAALAAKSNAIDSARMFKERAITTFEKLGAPHLAAMRRLHLAALEFGVGNTAKSIALAQQALKASEQMQLLNVEADALQMLAQAYEKLRKPGEALTYYKRQKAILDSVFSADRRDELARLHVQFDTELKEGQIRELRQKEKLQVAEATQQRQRLWSLGLTLGLVVVGLSVTLVLMLRLRRSRAQLAAMIQTKDRLYALVAHDLRGPVQSLDSVPGIIKMYLRRNDVEALNELPPLIADAVRQVNQLLDNLLHWAASQTGELSFHPEPLPIQLLLDECVALWNNTATANQVQLVVPPAPTDITVRADPQMVRTVLRNLVGNALKFTPAGGTVTVAVEADAARTTLLVRDTGPGISSADAAALLRVEAAPDSRLRRSGARGEKGTGLGLRLCMLFMRRHGGMLTLDGQPGTGTTARAIFPAN